MPTLMQPTYLCKNSFVRDLQNYAKISHIHLLLSLQTMQEREESIKTYVNTIKLYLRYFLNSETIAMHFLEMNLVLIAQGSRDALVV